MSPQEWADFEESVRKGYEDKIIGELMNEASNLSYALQHPEKFPRLNNLDWDKLNLRLRVVGEVFEARINKIIEGSMGNGKQTD